MISIFWLVISCFSWVAMVIFAAFRLKIIYKLFGVKSKTWPLYEACQVTATANTFLPLGIGGLLTRPLILKKTQDLPIKTSLAASAVEGIVEMAVQIMFLIIILAFFGLGLKISFVSFAILFCLMLALMIFIFYSRQAVWLTQKLFGLLKIFPTKVRNFLTNKLKLKEEELVQLLENVQDLPNKSTFLILTAVISFLMIFAYSLPLFFFFKAAGIEITFIKSVIIYWVSYLVGHFSSLPGGFVAREGSMIYLLTYYGFPLAWATAFTLSFRAAMAAVQIPWGIILASKIGVSIFGKSKVKQSVQESQPKP